MTEQAGSLADEAGKLVGAIEDWWAGARTRLGDAAASATSVAAAAGTHQGPECRICPICQLLAILRGTKPEVFEHLAEASNALLLALRSALDAHAESGTQRPTAQRIDIT